jgi:hypothetical protein
MFGQGGMHIMHKVTDISKFKGTKEAECGA